MGEVTAAEVTEAAKRPMRYFSHDADAAEDMRCCRLRRRYGWEGYGRWWRLCELLAAEHGHRLDMGDEDVVGIVAMKLDMEDEELVKFVMFLAEVGLLRKTPRGTVWSDRMERNAEAFGKKRAAGMKGMKSRWKK